MKAQMEMLGLVVIVILFIFGGLIYLFFISKPADTSLSETRQSSEVSNLLNSMMKLTPCKDTTDSLGSIIHNCYLFNGNTDYCGNPDCRDYIKNIVRDVGKAYNPSWQYLFEVKEKSSLFLSYGSCNLTKRMAADTSIRMGTTTLQVALTACPK